MEALGRVLNLVGAAAGVEIDMTDADAVTFVLQGNEEFTIQEAQDGSGTGAQDLAVLDRYHAAAGAGTGAWTLNEPTASATVTPDAGDAVVFTVGCEELSAGFTHVLVNNTSAGTVVAILHDLKVQRDPENLRVLTG